MKAVVVGLGVQGNKRKFHAESDFVASVDPINPDADFNTIDEVGLSNYDAALVCLPDKPKYTVIKYLLENKKHVLVEKPLWTETNQQIMELQNIARKNKLVCYTAYNHRFEPHFINMKKLIDSGKLGEIYSCRLFYGNGTARLVRDSAWRDQGSGVLHDLGSHLLDTINYWFGILPSDFDIVAMNNFENNAPDHVILTNQTCSPKLNFEMTLLSWRNHFVCEIFAEKGTAHIESLCKWGPSKFTHRVRIYPSGRPPETIQTIVSDDPTWAQEYKYFKSLVEMNYTTDLSIDIWIQEQLGSIEQKYLKEKLVTV